MTGAGQLLGALPVFEACQGAIGAGFVIAPTTDQLRESVGRALCGTSRVGATFPPATRPTI